MSKRNVSNFKNQQKIVSGKIITASNHKVAAGFVASISNAITEIKEDSLTAGKNLLKQETSKISAKNGRTGGLKHHEKKTKPLETWTIAKYISQESKFENKPARAVAFTLENNVVDFDSNKKILRELTGEGTVAKWIRKYRKLSPEEKIAFQKERGIF